MLIIHYLQCSGSVCGHKVQTWYPDTAAYLRLDIIVVYIDYIEYIIMYASHIAKITRLLKKEWYKNKAGLFFY
mgnify:CR=1 FL=1